MLFFFLRTGKVYIEGQGQKNFILSIAGPGRMVIGPGLYTDSRHIFSMTAIRLMQDVALLRSDIIKKYGKR